uniref:Si:dkeyp-23e4.3 n=1 Tax=Latimeria chalumnae TaxID=7897 RepID=H3B8G5_LATCH
MWLPKNKTTTKNPYRTYRNLCAESLCCVFFLEIEAKEACEWLKAAGFPQYAQLFEDLQFPVDIDIVKKDHEFLDQDAIESLCRRLNTLNKCATMKLEIGRQRKRSDESEEDEPCALSTKWSFERHSKRWSRLESLECFHPNEASSSSVPDSPRLKSTDSEDVTFPDIEDKHEVSSLNSCSSGDSDFINFPKPSEDLETSRSSSRCSSTKWVSLDSTLSCPPSPNIMNFSGKEKIAEKPPKKRGNSLLKKMGKLRVRSSSLKRSSRSKFRPVISGPVLQEDFDEEKLKELNCISISELDSSSTRNLSCSSLNCSSSSPSENSSTVSTPSPVIRARNYSKRSVRRTEDFDSNKLYKWKDVCEQNIKNERNLQENLIFQIPQGHKPGTFPKALTNDNLSPINNTNVNWRTGSFHGCRRSRTRTVSCNEVDTPCSPLASLDNRFSIYDNVPGIHAHLNETMGSEISDDVFTELDNVMEHVNGLQKLVHQWSEKFSDDGDSDFANDSTSPCPPSPKEIHLEIKKHSEGKMSTPTCDSCNSDKPVSEAESPEFQDMRDSGMGSSLSHSNRNRELYWINEQSPDLEVLNLQVDSQPAVQMNLLQKLALLKLTTLMDKHSPSSKQGWNWTIPKFIRKIRTPDYKDRNVFGVPLLLNVQRIGHPLPRSILKAMQFLKDHCLDQVGLFRKSGVKSRIQALREMNEVDPQNISYEEQSAFDVADMLKQYFRDLPEPIFTTKLCESFLHIYQYLPKDQQFFAVQAAVLLLPDENRETLQTLLYFFNEVVACVEENQMTPTNIAVCLAPSLFHLNTLRRENSTTSRSCQRKYSLGKPDQRDLSENLAASRGLAHMIAECSRLFQVPDYWPGQSLDSLIDQNIQFQGTRSPTDYEKHCGNLDFLQQSIHNLLREAKEKFKSWVNCANVEQVELAYKKIEDGHLLKLWKASVEVDAVPEAVLQRILRERPLWDQDLQQHNVLQTLDKETEIYHFTVQSATPHPPRDYVVLRTWQTDPQTGTSVLAATSVDSEEAFSCGIRGEVLICQYLIETVGPQKTKLSHICRTDTSSRGRTTEWYSRLFGHMCAAEVIRIKDSFKPAKSEVKETKI